MNDQDELVPVRPRGRPIRAVSLADCLEQRPARKNGITCVKCPKWRRALEWCPILAQNRRGDLESCKYGKILIAQKERKMK